MKLGDSLIRLPLKRKYLSIFIHFSKQQNGLLSTDIGDHDLIAQSSYEISFYYVQRGAFRDQADIIIRS